MLWRRGRLKEGLSLGRTVDETRARMAWTRDGDSRDRGVASRRLGKEEERRSRESSSREKTREEDELLRETHPRRFSPGSLVGLGQLIE